MERKPPSELVTRGETGLTAREKYDQRLEAYQRQQMFSVPMQHTDYMINRQYLNDLSLRAPVEYNGESNTRIFQVTRLVLDEKENMNDKLMSIYGAVHSMGAALFLMIHSEADALSFYIGVRDNRNDVTSGKILAKGVEGNFMGSCVSEALERNQAKALMHQAVFFDSPSTAVSAVSVIPSERDDDKDKFVQGIEKFIDSLRGQRYTALILCDPVESATISDVRKGLEQLYSTIASRAKITYTYGTNMSKSVSDTLSIGFSESIGTGVSRGTSSSTSNGTNQSSGWSSQGGLFGPDTTSQSSGSSYSYTESLSNSISENLSRGRNDGTSQGITESNGETESQTLTIENKSVQNLMADIDEQLKRIKECEAYGMWECAAYFISDDEQVSTIAANTYRALMCGRTTKGHNAYINRWNRFDENRIVPVLNALKQLQHPTFEVPALESKERMMVRPTQLLSGREVPIFAGLPHHSVNGLPVQKMAAFGREIALQGNDSSTKSIHLGNVMHMGLEEEQNPVWLDVDLLTSHTFITGSTGSGKSNTTYQLLGQLIENGIGFMVIEPAKGEYKKEFGALSDINVFWTNPTGYRQLHLNPFRFPEGITVLEHVDQLIEIFNACWPMYAAMPAIFKDGMERIYTRCGWDLNSSLHFDNGRAKYPTFQDLLEVLPQIINESSYSSESKGDYIGALVTRVKSMTTGLMGQVLCCKHDISEEVLFDGHTVIDLSHVGAAETKSLLMGLLVMRLKEYRIVSTPGENVPLRHVTIIEEAHNLLKRTSTEQSQESANLAGKSIEMISASIAEMRTYGEGFVIVDQSPTAVDISAIKNTNTKIVMKLPEKNDIETIGGAFSLDEEQINQIARLGRGEAIVYQSNWQEPVLCKVRRWNKRYYCPQIRENASQRRRLLGKLLTYVYENDDKWSERAMLRIIDESEAIEPLKQTCREMTAYFLDDISLAQGNARIRLLAGVGIDWLGCTGLREAIPLRFQSGELTEENADIFTEWVTRMDEALAQYIEFPNQETEHTFLRFYMLYYAPVSRQYQLAYRFATLE